MDELLKFFIGVSPILIIMIATLIAGLYVIIKRRR